MTRNVALVAHAPRLRAIPKVEQRAWTAEELQAFLRAAAGHRLFAALWTAAFTGMRRNELLGLCWDDLDAAKATVSVNRGLVAIGYDLHETRGKTRNARRRIDLDPTTVAVLDGWRAWQTVEQRAIGLDPTARMFIDGHGEAIHPHAISQTFERIARRAGVPIICTTCATRTARCSSPPAYPSRSSANGSATQRPRSPSRPTSTSCRGCRPKPPVCSKGSSFRAFYRPLSLR